jgi:HEPN domain-containing protein
LGILVKYLESLGRSELVQRISEFIAVWRDSLKILEDAYTEARYMPKSFDRVDAEKALNVVEELFRVVEAVESSVFT